MGLEKKLTENEWKGDIWIKLSRTEALLKSVLEIQSILLQKSFNISAEKSAEIVSNITNRNIDELIHTVDLTFED